MAPDISENPGIAKFGTGVSGKTQQARDGDIPLGRTGRKNALGNIMALLASDMAPYLGGITLPVHDGTAASAGWGRALGSSEWTPYHAG